MSSPKKKSVTVFIWDKPGLARVNLGSLAVAQPASIIGRANIHTLMFTDLKTNRFQNKLMVQNTIYEYWPIQLSTLAMLLITHTYRKNKEALTLSGLSVIHKSINVREVQLLFGRFRNCLWKIVYIKNIQKPSCVRVRCMYLTIGYSSNFQLNTIPNFQNLSYR